MAKRLSKKEIEEIVKSFTFGKTVDDLSDEFDCTKLTISRHLKRNLGYEKFKNIIDNSKLIKNAPDTQKTNITFENKNNLNKDKFNENFNQEKFISNKKEEELSPLTPFIELTPLDYEIENTPRQDLTSIPISKIKFPKIVYMIVDKNIELKTKYLKDYPDWQFLSKDELNRKTIEIYIDLKNAKRFCNKEQKVIKVPNTEVFRIVAPILLSRGISRIVNSDKLIAL